MTYSGARVAGGKGSGTAKAMAALANFPQVMSCARFLADMGVLRDEDVLKCARVYLRKHPEIERCTNGAMQQTIQALMKNV